MFTTPFAWICNIFFDVIVARVNLNNSSQESLPLHPRASLASWKDEDASPNLAADGDGWLKETWCWKCHEKCCWKCIGQSQWVKFHVYTSIHPSIYPSIRNPFENTHVYAQNLLSLQDFFPRPQGSRRCPRVHHRAGLPAFFCAMPRLLWALDSADRSWTAGQWQSTRARWEIWPKNGGLDEKRNFLVAGCCWMLLVYLALCKIWMSAWIIRLDDEIPSIWGKNVQATNQTFHDGSSRPGLIGGG